MSTSVLIRDAIQRAQRGFREDMRLHLVALTSLSVAFLCLLGALLAQVNLARVATHWGSASRVTVYIRDGASGSDVESVRTTLEAQPVVRGVEIVSSSLARERFARDIELRSSIDDLPTEAFPTSLEVTLAAGTSRNAVDTLAARLQRLPAVEDVESYRTFFERLERFLLAARSIVGIVALLVVLAVLAVVGNTIRLAVAGRRAEVEVLKLCGATDGFVRRPFVVEGAVQGLTAAAIAIILSGALFLVFRSSLDAALRAFSGIGASFLHPTMVLAVLVGGAVVGAAGSAGALRRYLSI